VVNPAVTGKRYKYSQRLGATLPTTNERGRTMDTWTTVRKGLIINNRISYGYLAFIWERMGQVGAKGIEMEGGGIEG